MDGASPPLASHLPRTSLQPPGTLVQRARNFCSEKNSLWDEVSEDEMVVFFAEWFGMVERIVRDFGIKLLPPDLWVVCATFLSFSRTKVCRANEQHKIAMSVTGGWRISPGHANKGSRC